MSYKTVPLKHAAEFLDNLRIPVTESERKPGPYPYYGANGQQGWIDGYIFDEPLVLLAEDGGHFGSKTKPIAYKVTGQYWVNNHAHVLRPKSNCNIDYLHRALSYYDVTQFINGTTRQKLTKGQAADLPIPLPPLDEQRRIADILSRADRLRRLRRTALQLSDGYLQSVFLQMFGDPVSNPMGWEIHKLNTQLERIDSGWSPVCDDEARTDANEWAILKLSAVTTGKYLPAENKRFPSDLEPKPNLEVKRGDVLITRKNTFDLVAACAFVFQTSPRLMLPDTIFRFVRRNDAKIEPEFIWGLFNEDAFRRSVQGLASGTAGSMPNISKEKFMGLSIPLPPLALQQKFAGIVRQVERLRGQQREAARQAEGLFQSLLARGFGGEI